MYSDVVLRRTEAGAEPLGPGGVPRRDFQSCPAIVKKSSATQQGSPSYSAKFTLLSQKQRRYTYDSDVYVKIFLKFNVIIPFIPI